MKICVQGALAPWLGHGGVRRRGGFRGSSALMRTAPSSTTCKPPSRRCSEGGLAELTAAGIATGRLSFTTDLSAALSGTKIVWVAFDTPVDEEDRADVDFVRGEIAKLFPYLEDGATLLISSQLPVGSTRALAREFEKVARGRRVAFGYSPENLRLGTATQRVSSSRTYSHRRQPIRRPVRRSGRSYRASVILCSGFRSRARR